MKPNGYVLWEGISRLDGETDIAVVATGFTRPSTNAVTGPMIQVWIIPKYRTPSNGQDAVCGDCKIKQFCYVRGDTVLQVWKSYKRGAYPRVSSLADVAALVRNRGVRLGAWGDPAAMPTIIIHTIYSNGAPVTGYTQAWKREPYLRRYLMASVISRSDANAAQAMGWRTFRIRKDDALYPDEEDCPAKRSDGKLPLSCYSCGLCSGRLGRGGDGLRYLNVSTPWHGARGKHLLV